MTDRTTRRRYREAVASFVDLAQTLDADEWTVPVPATPGWSVRDVLSHVSGVSDDIVAGRTAGAASETWTASQVERNASFTVEELISRWQRQCPDVAAAIDAIGEERPPFDCHAHEHDIRHALGRPGNRRSGIVIDSAPALLARLDGLPVELVVDFGDGTSRRTGRGDAHTSVVLEASRFEIFRSILGRRTRDQVRNLGWSGESDDIDRVVADWFAFGPSEIEIDE